MKLPPPASFHGDGVRGARAMKELLVNQNGTLLDSLCERAKANPQRIAFPEAFDPTVLTAAHRIASEGTGIPILVGKRAELEELCAQQGFDPQLFEYVDIDDEARKEALVAEYSKDETKKYRGDDLLTLMSDPLYYAAVMQSLGLVRLAPAGFVRPTSDVARALLRIVGVNENGLGSSIGLVQLPDTEEETGRFIFLADISICPNPTAEQLARIAIDSCDTARAIMDMEPVCALLSYSTKGSARGPEVEKVAEAARIANELRPDLLIDGEYQLDAAINPVIGAKKAGADNPVAGKANILVFPDLAASNISVKLLEHFAGGKLFGAILQGFNQICSDSSRGATVDELVGTIVAATLAAEGVANQQSTAQQG